MKKVLRPIAAVMCIVMLAVTLCSCQYIDDARSKHAVYTDDKKSTLIFRDKEYKKVNIKNSNTTFIMNESIFEDCYATNSDVPVLLRSMYGDDMYLSEALEDEKNPTLITIYRYGMSDYSSATSISKGILSSLGTDIDLNSTYSAVVSDSDFEIVNYYVREDKYDSVVYKLDNAQIDRFCKIVTEYDDPSDTWMGGKTTCELIDESVCKAVNTVLKNNDTITVDKLDKNNEWWGIMFISCDDEMFISDNRNVLVISDGLDYYAFYVNTTVSNPFIHKVDDKNRKIFTKLFNDYQNYREYIDLSFYENYTEN